MMRTWPSFYFQAFVAILFFTATFFYLYSKYPQEKVIYLHQLAASEQMRPVGEILDGSRFVQSVSVDLMQSTKHQGERPICLEVLLANYSNRRNLGTVSLELSIGGKIFREPINMQDVADNIYHRICYAGFGFADLEKLNEAQITLEGIGGAVGSSITAWTTTDLSLGSLVSTAGEPLERSLLYRFVQLEPAIERHLHTLVLALLFAVSISVLLLHPQLLRWPTEAQSRKD